MKQMELKEFPFVVIDADSILYKLAAVNQTKEWRTDDGKIFDEKELLNVYLKAHPERNVLSTEVIAGELQPAIDSFQESILNYGHEACITAYIGGPHRVFRYGIATRTKYKGNRSSKDKPVLLSRLTEEVAKLSWVNRASDLLEADDDVLHVMNELQEIFGEDSVVLAGIDKDALQQKGWHYNYDTRELKYVSEVESYRYLMTQMLTGDVVDNIKGPFGVGAKSAYVKKLNDMSTLQEMFDSVRTVYEKHYNNFAEHFMLENYKLLRMCIDLKPVTPVIEFGDLWRGDGRKKKS